MKTLVTFIISIASLVLLNAQNNIETQSVTLDNIINFTVNNFPIKNDLNNSNATLKPKKISILLETRKKNFSIEDKAILKQALKFLTTRLSKDDVISIIVYSGQNGLLLDRISAKEIKKILNAVDNVKNNITDECVDGISMAYQLAQENYESEAQNLILMVRNPNATNGKTISNNIEETATNAVASKNNTGSVVLLTALTLLPELISVIKD